MARKKHKEISVDEANDKLGDGWALPALAAVTALGYGFITDDILGATLIGGSGGGYAIRILLRKRRGHDSHGKRREWHVRGR